MTIAPRRRALVPEDLRSSRAPRLTTLTRAVITAANTHLDPNTTSETFVRRRWGSAATDSVATFLRATSAPASTATTGWAKELGQTTQAFLANLVPLSAGADLLGRGLQLTFDGSNVVNIPNVTAPLADFVGQNAPIPVVAGTSNVQASLSPNKFGCIVVLTREMIESSNAEELVRQALLDATAPSLDRRLFDSNAAVADLRPAGLLNGKVALTPSGASEKGSAMINDLSVLAEAVAPYAGNGGIVFVAAPRQAVATNIGLPNNFPYPMLVSSSALTQGTVIAVAINAVVSALGAVPEVDLTKAATLHMSDVPTAIATGGTMAGPTTVTFQNDTVGVRLRWPISWALRNANAIAFMSAVTWP